MQADTIVALLREKHKEDVFVAECKDGPTVFGSHLRMDAWTMNRSWSNPCTSGYEVKVGRSDYLQDDKWPGYLPLCNKFWFVSPADVIHPSEVPESAGLMHVASTGRILRTVKKAPYRQVDDPVALYRYILMCRATIKGAWAESEGDRQARLDFWRRWLADKEASLEIGHHVSQKLSQKVKEEIRAVRRNQHDLELRLEKLEAVRGILADMGIREGTWFLSHEVKQQIERARAAIPDSLRNDLEVAKREIEKVLADIGQLQGTGDPHP
jgi:hypothetical protein